MGLGGGVNPPFTLIGAPWWSPSDQGGVIMPVEMLTYSAIAERLGCSSEGRPGPGKAPAAAEATREQR
jgi:hypothetical protein